VTIVVRVTATLVSSSRTDQTLLGDNARLFAGAGVLSACMAQVVIGVLTVSMRRVVDPIRGLVSDYAFFPQAGRLFDLAVVLALLSGVLVCLGLLGTDVPSNLWVNVLFGLWMLGLVLVVVFRGNQTSRESTLHGSIHRFGGALLLLCLPLACWILVGLLLRDPRLASVAGALRRLAVLAFGVTAVFGMAQFEPALPEGLLERAAFGIEFALLAGLAVAVRRSSR
jgi:hypothetical protein